MHLKTFLVLFMLFIVGNLAMPAPEANPDANPEASPDPKPNPKPWFYLGWGPYSWGWGPWYWPYYGGARVIVTP